MKITRRKALTTGAAVLGGSLVSRPSQAHDSAVDPDRHDWESDYSGNLAQAALRPGVPGRDYTPVITPGGRSLPFELVDGAKGFHLTAEELWHQFAPGLRAKCWGYNGQVHGPTIEAVEGDHIRIYVTNRLIAPTSIHWHGLFLPNGMDGVGGLNQSVIHPGETFKYEWTLRQHGTFMYHSHHDEMTQMAMGLMGMFIIHPRRPSPSHHVDRDFAIMLSEWRIDPGTYRPNPNEMSDFNVLTMNAQCYPGTVPMIAKQGDRVRMRIGNLSAMDHHPIHLHGHYFKITATDGGHIPISAQWPETTVLVPVGTTRDVEFIASEPGDWAMHCHMTHHVMNQMGHQFPNMIGVEPGGLDSKVRSLLPAYMTMGQDGMGEMATMGMAVPENSIPMVGAHGPFDYITMGGMFTIFKVRRDLDSYDDPGWYNHPAGKVAERATASDLRRDQIDT